MKMTKFKIFISGAQKELKAERRAVKEFILGNVLLSEYFDVFLFEDAPAKSKCAEKAYLDGVTGCDIYIGILGDQYGCADKDGISPTEAEFREAKAKHKDILVYIKGEGSVDMNRDAGVRKLIKEIRDSKHGFSYRRFNGANDLNRLVYASLIDFLKEKGIVGRGAFDERICAGATMKDIDDEKVRWFLGVSRSQRKYPLAQNTPVKDVLIHLNLLRDGKITNAAVLLFGKDPHKFFLQAEVKCVQFFGTEVKKPFTSYKVYNGNLFEQVDKAVAFVLDILKQAVIQQEHTPQFKRPFEIPIFAIQEAIVNALAHRNYNVTSGVQVMVFSDRLEIWNSGSLPPELGVEDLRKPHTSYPANPFLANALYFADYIQKMGSGTLEMIEQCRAQNAPDPEFVLIRNVEFRTILPRDMFTADALTNMGLNERQIKAVTYVKEKGRITNREYRQLNNISDEGARRDLSVLLEKKIFRTQGRGRSSSYIL